MRTSSRRESRSPLIRSGVYLGRSGVMEMREGFTYGAGHDSQVPEIPAVIVLEKVVEAVGSAVRAGVPS